jgi:hypothetical protein
MIHAGWVTLTLPSGKPVYVWSSAARVVFEDESGLGTKVLCEDGAAFHCQERPETVVSLLDASVKAIEDEDDAKQPSSKENDYGLNQ